MDCKYPLNIPPTSSRRNSTIELVGQIPEPPKGRADTPDTSGQWQVIDLTACKKYSFSENDPEAAKNVGKAVQQVTVPISQSDQKDGNSRIDELWNNHLAAAQGMVRHAEGPSRLQRLGTFCNDHKAELGLMVLTGLAVGLVVTYLVAPDPHYP